MGKIMLFKTEYDKHNSMQKINYTSPMQLYQTCT